MIISNRDLLQHEQEIRTTITNAQVKRDGITLIVDHYLTLNTPHLEARKCTGITFVFPERHTKKL